jgi:hypothetical protein
VGCADELNPFDLVNFHYCIDFFIFSAYNIEHHLKIIEFGEIKAIAG